MGEKGLAKSNQFPLLVLLFNVICIVIFAIFADYGSDAMPGGSSDPTYINSKYPLFADVHVMIFIGFGFLMTFLRRYGFSSVSLNLLLASVTIQWSIIIRGFMSTKFADDGVFTVSIDELLTADFAAAVVLITFGAVLGKLSPTQYLVMVVLETPAALVTEHIIVHKLHVNDLGGSIVVHAFGAYFGLAVSRVLYRQGWDLHREHEGSVYHSDLFSMVGTLFLWVFWPSFNAAVADPEDARHRAILNTYLALVACTITAFVLSQLVSKHRTFNMVHIANSTLAGGVAIGTTANVVLNPSHALIVGTVAGALSVVGYEYITPFMDRRLKIQDTCGVHNLHGMPGVLAGLIGVLLVLVYNPERYGRSLTTIYPSFKTSVNSDGRDVISQALYQLIGLVIAVVSALVTGAVTGVVLRLSIWNQVREREMYSDGQYFHTPEDFDFTTRITSQIDHVSIEDRKKLSTLTTSS
ncbi:CBN-RHR-1 protein [Aphelenchoides avenae]|nr:CBN-RHR-1 protein [Aphelenchus avenae]